LPDELCVEAVDQRVEPRSRILLEFRDLFIGM